MYIVHFDIHHQFITNTNTNIQPHRKLLRLCCLYTSTLNTVNLLNFCQSHYRKNLSPVNLFLFHLCWSGYYWPFLLVSVNCLFIFFFFLPPILGIFYTFLVDVFQSFKNIIDIDPAVSYTCCKYFLSDGRLTSFSFLVACTITMFSFLME